MEVIHQGINSVSLWMVELWPSFFSFLSLLPSLPLPSLLSFSYFLSFCFFSCQYWLSSFFVADTVLSTVVNKWKCLG